MLIINCPKNLKICSKFLFYSLIIKVIIVSLLVSAVVCVILAKSKSKILKMSKTMFYIFNYFCEDCPQNEVWNEWGSAYPTTCERLEPRVE
jgi:hypothetical protein